MRDWWQLWCRACFIVYLRCSRRGRRRRIDRLERELFPAWFPKTVVAGRAYERVGYVPGGVYQVESVNHVQAFKAPQWPSVPPSAAMQAWLSEQEKREAKRQLARQRLLREAPNTLEEAYRVRHEIYTQEAVEKARLRRKGLS